MPNLIQISGLTKYYGRAKQPAVSDLSLKIAAGEVYGLLGANGAGKSTTLRLVMDFIRPSQGSIKLLGKDNQLFGPELRRQVGYLSGDVVLPKRVTSRALLEYLQRLNGQTDTTYLDELCRRFTAQIDKHTNTLSKGNRQKIGLIQAFMHQPKVLILDEPTSGLDPLMQEEFYKTVNEARQRGAAVLLSSHSFEDVERVCDRIGIVKHGQLVYEGPVLDIIATRKPRWRVTYKKAADAAKLSRNPELKVFSCSGPILTAEPAGSIEAALKTLASQPIVSITTNQHELEDEFLSYYDDSAEEAEL